MSVAPYGPFTLAAGVLLPVTTAQSPTVGAVVIINESPYTLRINPGTGSYYVVSAFTQDKLLVGSGYSGKLLISPIADIMVSGSPPVSVLYVLAAATSDELPGTYPAALTRLANIGNTVNTGGSVNSINNQNEAAPIDVIFDQPTGYSLPSIHLLDTAELHLTPKGNGTQADALAVLPGGGLGNYATVQLDNGAIATDGLGNLSTAHVSATQLNSSGALGVVGASSFDNGRLATDGSGKLELDGTAVHGEAPGSVWIEAVAGGGAGTVDLTIFDSTGGSIKIQLSGGTFFNVTGGSTQLDSAAIRTDGNGGLRVGSGGSVSGAACKGWSRFTGTGDGTFAHGMGTTPNHFSPCQSVAGSETMGYNTVGATNVTIKTGANLAFSCVAFVF